MLPVPGRSPWRVLLVDSHALFTAGIANILIGTEFEIVSTAGTATEAILQANKHWPEIVLLDIRLDGLERWELLEILSSTSPRTFPAARVLLLTSSPDATFRAQALSGGAAGYLDKGKAASVLLEAMRSVVRGEAVSNPKPSLLKVCAGKRLTQPLPSELTAREYEVLQQLTTGGSNRVIGKTLFVSAETVKSHVSCILHKLNVPGRTQAAVWAVQNGYGLPLAEAG